VFLHVLTFAEVFLEEEHGWGEDMENLPGEDALYHAARLEAAARRMGSRMDALKG
jgi:hypothetical protein